jgi:predicted nucleic acid-binding protein
MYLGIWRRGPGPNSTNQWVTRDSAENVTRNCQSRVRVFAEEDGFWDIYREVTKDVSTRGYLLPDAHLAALLSQHGVVTLYTHDRDFRKFSFLDVRDPVA